MRVAGCMDIASFLLLLPFLWPSVDAVAVLPWAADHERHRAPQKEQLKHLGML